MAVLGDPSKSAGVAVLRALGLPTDDCLSLHISFMPDSLVQVTVAYAPNRDQVEAVVQTMKGYMVALTPCDG